MGGLAVLIVGSDIRQLGHRVSRRIISRLGGIKGRLRCEAVPGRVRPCLARSMHGSGPELIIWEQQVNAGARR